MSEAFRRITRHERYVTFTQIFVSSLIGAGFTLISIGIAFLPSAEAKGVEVIAGLSLYLLYILTGVAFAAYGITETKKVFGYSRRIEDQVFCKPSDPDKDLTCFMIVIDGGDADISLADKYDISDVEIVARRAVGELVGYGVSVRSAKLAWNTGIRDLL